MEITLSDFLSLSTVKVAVEKIFKNDFFSTTIKINGFEDKILITKHLVGDLKSKRGFKSEEITNGVFAVIPKNLSLIKN